MRPQPRNTATQYKAWKQGPAMFFNGAVALGQKGVCVLFLRTKPRHVHRMYNDILFSGARRFAVCITNPNDGTFSKVRPRVQPLYVHVHVKTRDRERINSMLKAWTLIGRVLVAVRGGFLPQGAQGGVGADRRQGEVHL